jgi:hypothetical protein
MHGHVGAAFVDLDDPGHVGEVELRVDALRVDVHRHRHDVHVAGALAVAEQRALDAVRAGQEPELAGRDAQPRSLCVCRLTRMCSRCATLRQKYSIWSANTLASSSRRSPAD